MGIIKYTPRFLRNFISKILKKNNNLIFSALKLFPRSTDTFKTATIFNGYFHLSDYKNKYENLIMNIDNASKEVVENFASMQIYIYTHNFIEAPHYQWTNTYDNSEIAEIKNKFGKYCNGEYFFQFSESLFKEHSGLKYVTNLEVPLKGDILDLGADFGDSSWVFTNYYKPRKIFAFEPLEDSFQKLEQFIIDMNLSSVIPIKKGVAEETGKYDLLMDGRTSHILSKQIEADKTNTEQIEVITIDDFVRENDVIPQVIKMDIEGKEYDAIVGAENTIRKFKPILLISLYHNPRDFFEIIPLLNSWNLGYKFQIKKLVSYDYPANEIMLIAQIS